MEVKADKVLDALIEERKLIFERRSLIFRTLAGFNPLVITLAAGAIVGLLTKEVGTIEAEKIPWIVFAGSQFGYLMGSFNFMILIWLRIEGLYMARLENQINNLTRIDGLICRESFVTPNALNRSGAAIFFVLFIAINAIYGIYAGYWAARELNSVVIWIVVGVESLFMGSGVLYELLFARRKYAVKIAQFCPMNEGLDQCSESNGC